ncbi:hypothetical protein [Vibrio sp. SCSIO 43140]|uniref:hypothetical protein n=1 Tax=Vibrio sp. SCSIO 43140 TaxID=2819100 RepID=UPI002076456F|nr:hypothetical protein [Vibrio sp. SCSIO 43140]
MKIVTFSLVVSSVLLVGCANDAPLGDAVANVRHQQTYDHSATVKNKDVVPTGTGARMQVAYDAYTGQTAYDAKAEAVLNRPLAVDSSDQF